MSHHCHATGCTASVPAEMFMCKKHWYRLPKLLRDRIWATYRPGQCEDWQISRAYSQAAKDAVSYLARLEGRTPDLSVYEVLEPGNPLGDVAREIKRQVEDQP